MHQKYQSPRVYPKYPGMGERLYVHTRRHKGEDVKPALKVCAMTGHPHPINYSQQPRLTSEHHHLECQHLTQCRHKGKLTHKNLVLSDELTCKILFAVSFCLGLSSRYTSRQPTRMHTQTYTHNTTHKSSSWKRLNCLAELRLITITIVIDNKFLCSRNYNQNHKGLTLEVIIIVIMFCNPPHKSENVPFQYKNNVRSSPSFHPPFYSHRFSMDTCRNSLLEWVFGGE